MKALLLNTYSSTGGAAKAVNRITNEVTKKLPKARMVTLEPSKLAYIDSPFPNIYRHIPYLDFAFGFLQTLKRIPYFPAYLPFNGLEKIIRSYNPDILHLNWMQGGFLDFRDYNILKQLPVVWTFHDLWPITGGCSYPGACKNYLSGCGSCPLFNFPHKRDMSYRSFIRKQTFLQSLPETAIVTPSTWLKNTIISSGLLPTENINVIHNGIDTSQYQIHSKPEAKKSLGVNNRKALILFGAIGSTKNPSKGFDLLFKALDYLDPDEFQFIVFGASNYKPSHKRHKIRYFGYLSDKEILNRLYSAADVMVVPSREEVFGQTVIEAMASGTAVVSFKNTGPADIIAHKKNGFLTTGFSAESLAEGIQWVKDNNPVALGLSARMHCESDFDISITADKYISLYKSIQQK